MMPIARAMNKIFLMMYCPSMVGINGLCQLRDLSKKSGVTTIAICVRSRAMASLSK